MIKQNTIKFILLLLGGFIITGCVSSMKMLMSEDERNEAFAKYIQSENLESLDRITTFRFDSFSTLTDQTLIITTNFRRAYLISLKHRCTNLRYANSLKVNSTGSSLMAKFDSVSHYTNATHGEKCFIKTIHRITQEQKQAIQNIGREQPLEEEIESQESSEKA